MNNYIQRLTEQNLLLHLNESPLEKKNGLILVSCGDCDKAHELISFEKRKCKEKVGHSRVHLLTLNGGALAIHPDSPVNQKGKSDVLLLDIEEANPMKQIEDLALYGHFVCGKAKSLNLTVKEYFFWLAKAAVRCQEVFPFMNIACKIHVDANLDTEFKTYYFDHLNWLWFLEHGESELSSASSSAS